MFLDIVRRNMKKKEIKTNAMRLLDEHNASYTHYSFDPKGKEAKTGVGVAEIIKKKSKTNL